MKSLVVYESPNKFKTFSSMFEGMDVSFCYTQGRIYDLADDKLGVRDDLSLELQPVSKDRCDFLINKIKNHKQVYCLTDNDPEGEWIASHIKELCEQNSSEFLRVRVEELTKSSLSTALENASSELNDENLALAVSRRTIDRIIGFYDNPNKESKRGRVITPVINHIHQNETFQTSTLVVRKDGVEMVLEGNVSKLGTIEDTIKRNSGKILFEDDGIESDVALYNTRRYLQDRATFHNTSPQEAFEDLQNLYEMGSVSYTRTENEKYNVLNGEHKGIHCTEELDVEDAGDVGEDGLSLIKLRTLIHLNPSQFSVKEHEPSMWLTKLCTDNDVSIVSISSIKKKAESRHQIPKQFSLISGNLPRSRKVDFKRYEHNKECLILRMLNELRLGTPATVHTHTRKIKALVHTANNEIQLNSNGMRVALQTDNLSMQLSSLEVSKELDELIFNNRLSIEDRCKKCLNVLRISDPTTSDLSLDR